MQTDLLTTYRQFCRTAPPDFPVFMQDWYLDAVCADGRWAPLIWEEAGRVVAVWPLFFKKKGPWEYVAMPLMGKMMGPYLLPECRKLSKEMRILEGLLGQLPTDLAAFQQDFNYTNTNWLPFYWQGFQQTTRYSYLLPLQKPETELWAGISNDYRRKIKKAAEIVTVRSDLPLEELLRVCGLSFRRQELAFPLSLEYFQKIHHAFTLHQCARCFFAVDKISGVVHSAAYLVWDKGSAYYLLGGDDPALRASGSGILLQWSAIQYARDVLHLPLFDFEGSMIKSVEKGRRDFGAVQKPYFRIRKEWSALWKWGKFLFRT